MPKELLREIPVSHPDLLSVTEAARTLHLSQQTVRDMYHAGSLKGVRIGNCIKLYDKSVYALLERFPR